MRRLKKNYFITLFCATVGILGLVRVYRSDHGQDQKQILSMPIETNTDEDKAGHTQNEKRNDLANTRPVPGILTSPRKNKHSSSSLTTARNISHPHPIYSVPSFSSTFPDLQDTHAKSAKQWGVKPVRNRIEAERRKDELVFIGSNPYYKIDHGMSSSIPYLVPRAAMVLETIARNYLDSLHIKGIPMHKILVSSVLRTEEDVERLRRINVNASPESCHRYGTTFDIPYNRYHTVSPPDESRRAVQNDTLKWVLAEVLRDVRKNGLCHIKYEIKQGCFHITAR